MSKTIENTLENKAKFNCRIMATMLVMPDPFGKTIVLTEYHNPVYPKRNYDLGIFPKAKGKVSYD